MAEDELNERPGGGAGEPSDHNMLADVWRDHKTPILVVIAAITMLLVYLQLRAQQTATQSATQAGGTLASGGSAGVPTAQTSDSTQASYALSSYMQSILQYLQQFGQQQNGGQSGGSSPTPPTVSGPPIIAPGPSGGVHAPFPLPTPTPPPIRVIASAPEPAPAAAPEQFVTVGHWTPNPAWNTTLWGIANHEGVSLTRIEQLNPQISNPNLIYPQEQVRVR